MYLLDALQIWDAGGLLERLRQDFGSPSTLAKARDDCLFEMHAWNVDVSGKQFPKILSIWFCEKDLCPKFVSWDDFLPKHRVS